MKPWRLRPPGDSLSDGINGAPVFAGAPRNKTEDMQRVGVVRLRLQDAPARDFRMTELPGLKKPNSLLEIS